MKKYFVTLLPLSIIFVFGCTGILSSPTGTVSSRIPRSTDRPEAFSLFPSDENKAWQRYQKKAPNPATKTTLWKEKGGIPLKARLQYKNEIAPVTPWQFGVNISLWCGDKWLLDPDRIAKAREAGIQFWRFPGGTASNSYFWDGDYRGRTVNNEGRDPAIMSSEYFVDTKEFVQFCRATDSQAIFTLNYGASRYFDVETAAELALRWIDYLYEELDFPVLYWEIGNECYGPWEDGYSLPGKNDLRGDIYGRDYLKIAKILWEKYPQIYLGAPGVFEDDQMAYSGFRWWMRDMLPVIEGNVDFQVQHHYFGNSPFKDKQYVPQENSIYWERLPGLERMIDNCRMMEKKYTVKGENIPIALTEFNLRESPRQTIEMFNALYIAEVLGGIIKNRIPSACIWDWQNTLEPVSGGDNGLLSHNDPDIPEATPRPVYYTYALFHRAFGDTMLEVSQRDKNTTVLASRFSSGEVGLIIINRSKNKRNIQLDLGDFPGKGEWQGWVLDADDINDKQVRWNGIAGPKGGGGPFPLSTIPPYSGEYSPKEGLNISVKPFSVTGIVLY